MSTQNLHVLARIKLDELRRQRTTLSARYHDLDAQAQRPDVPLLARVDAVLAQLREMRFARTPLHPQAATLDAQLAVLRAEAASGRADDELLARALARLRVEIARGRTRVEFAQLFGEVIEEHLAAMARPERVRPADPGVLALVAAAPAEPLAVGAWFDRVIARRPAAFEPLLTAFAEKSRFRPLVATPHPATVRALLDGVAAGPLRAPALRAAAAEAGASPTTTDEYSDVLNIVLDRLDDWRWPEAGVPLHTVWDHGKCRVALEEGLVEMLFVDHVGYQWSKEVHGWRSGAGAPDTRARADALFAPHLPPAPRLDADPAALRAYHRDQGLHALDLELATRSNALALTLVANEIPGYDAGARVASIDEPTHQERLLATVVAQVTARRALAPERPLWVLQFDLRDFFPSVPHEAVLAALARLGLAPRWQRFLARYLAVPARHDGAPRPLRRGLVPGRALGWVLSELLLLPLECEIEHATGLRLLRVVDDVFVLTDDPAKARRAWTIAQDFAHAFGLALHPTKCGAVRLATADAAPADYAGLPAGRPRWGALRLDEDGTWRPDEARLEALRAWTREQVQGARSLLEMVSRYNAELVYLMRSLAVTVDLGGAHLDVASGVIAGFHQDLFGPGEGAREALVLRAEERLQGGASGDVLPSPLLHWPVTAGGLGLTQPMIVVHALRAMRAARGERKAPQDPRDEDLARVHRQLQKVAAQAAAGGPGGLDGDEVAQRVSRAVSDLAAAGDLWRPYATLLAETLAMAGPEASPELDALTRDFIARGTELGGRHQTGLSTYWRWVLHTYGPPLLEVVGTFRFLLTELVPLPLLLGARSGAPAARAGPGDGAPPPATPAATPRPGDDPDIPF